MTNSEGKRIAIIGAGIAGLAAAHRITEVAPSAKVTLFETSGQVGGVIGTLRQDGFLIEQSADSFITTVPAAIELCRRIGFADQLIPTESAARGALVVARGKLHRVPEGFVLMSADRLWPTVRSPILSIRGKLRLACELLIARRDGADESLASFARRRFGREVFERLIQPLIGGIYTADPEKLSLAATLPRFLEMERRYGSLIRAMRADRRSKRSSNVAIDSSDSGARYSMFVTPRDGLTSLIHAIAARLPAGCVRLNSTIDTIERSESHWRLNGMEFDAVIVSTSARVAANVLGAVDAALAAELAAIEYAGSAIVVFGYDRAQISHPLDSFGFVVPAIERRQILSASFSSIKFPGRAPAGKVLIRVFLGGALQPVMLSLSDERLRQIADDEISELLGIRGNASLSKIFRWHSSMPQYHLGHLERLLRIHHRLSSLPGLALAGSAYEGVGIPQCILSGEQAAEKVLAAIDGSEKSCGVATPRLP